MFYQEKTAPIVNNSSEVQSKIQALREKLEPFDSCFGSDYENLMNTLLDQMHELMNELHKGYITDAKQRLGKVFTLFWVIKDKLPSEVFDNIEELIYNTTKKQV